MSSFPLKLDQRLGDDEMQKNRSMMSGFFIAYLTLELSRATRACFDKVRLKEGFM